MTLPLPSPQSAEPDAFTEGLDMLPVSDPGEAAGFRCTSLCSHCGAEVIPGQDCCCLTCPHGCPQTTGCCAGRP